MATRTISPAGGSWNTVGAWVEGIVPTAADDVVATGASGALTVTAASLCRSMDLTGYTSTVSGSGDLTIGDASGGACTLAGTVSGTWTTTFVSTSSNGGTGWAVTSNGKSFPGLVTFNGAGGKWVLQDAFSVVASSAINSALLVTGGSFFGNGKAISLARMQISGSATRTVDVTNCSITLSLNTAGTAWNALSTTALTFVPTGSTITFTAASGGVSTLFGPLAYNNVVFNANTGAQNTTISATGTFANLTVNGGASKSASPILLLSGFTVTGTLTLAGNTVQGVNRMLFESDTPGTQRTITMTGAAVVISGDVDFMDVTITGSPSWTNAGSAFVGDALGNGSLITTNRTNPLTLFRVGAGGNWSASNWSLSSGGATGQRVPLPQDNVVVNASTTGTLTADMPRLGADLTFTGFAGTGWNVGTVATAMFGSLTLAAVSLVGGVTLTLAGRGTHTVTSAGQAFPCPVTFQGPGSTYTLQDALSTTGALTVNDGTFTTNNQSVTCLNVGASSGRTTVLNLGTSTITLTQTSTQTVWQSSISATTTNGASSTIVLSAASTNARTVAWGANGTGLGTLTYTVASSPGALILHNAAAARTLATLNVGSGRGLTVFAGATITITSAFNVNGVANGYLYLPGVAGNYASLPANGSLAITGTTIDIRGRASSDDWTPAIEAALVCNYHGATQAQRPFLLRLTTGGNLKLYNNISSSWTSTVAVPFADGATGWVRVTFDWSTGTAKFYTSTDATNDYTAVVWTQLGADVVSTSGSVATFTATPTIIGTYTSDNPVSNFWIGKVYRIAVLNGIDGPSIIDVDFTRSLASSGWLDAAKTQFTESSVNAATVTINGTLAQVGDGRVVLNSSTPGSAATLSKASGVVTGAFLSIKDSTATGGALWEAMGSSANVSGNTGWIFNAASRTATDTAPASDTAVKQLNRGRVTSDSAPASDAAARGSTAWARSSSDTAPASDSAGPIGTRSRSSSDSAPASDSASRGLLVARTASDLAAATDAATRSALAFFRAAVDSAPAGDTAARAGAVARFAADVAPAADTAGPTGTRARTAADTAPASDSASGAISRPRSAHDAAPAVDTAQPAVRLHVTAQDLAAAVDHASRVAFAHRFATDAAPAVDTVTGRESPRVILSASVGRIGRRWRAGPLVSR